MFHALFLVLPAAQAVEPAPWSPPPAPTWVRSPASDEGRKVIVHAVDDRGDPVPSATVLIDDEELRHRVDAQSGRWAGRSTYPMERAPEPFRVGRVLRLTVSAPGYLPRTVMYEIVAGRNTVAIPIAPLTSLRDPGDSAQAVDVASLLWWAGRDGPSLAQGTTTAVDRDGSWFDPDTVARLRNIERADPWMTTSFSQLLLAQGPGHVDAALHWANVAVNEAYTTSGTDFVKLVHDLYEVRAVAHHLRWQQHELERLADPARKHRLEAEKSRLEAAEIAAEWVEWAHLADQDTSLPAALCAAASDNPLDCTP
jgi:hypothetical protein